MHRHELRDEQWALVSDLFERPRRRGGRWRDHRLLFNAVVWVLSTGAPWRDLPERYGPWQTAWRRFDRWTHEGLWDTALDRLRVRRDGRGGVDWSLWCVDSTSIRASRAAAGAKKNKGRRTR